MKKSILFFILLFRCSFAVCSTASLVLPSSDPITKLSALLSSYTSDNADQAVELIKKSVAYIKELSDSDHPCTLWRERELLMHVLYDGIITTNEDKARFKDIPRCKLKMDRLS